MLCCSIATCMAEFSIDGISYSSNGTESNEVTITSFTDEIPQNVNLPEEVNNEGITYTVTQIGKGAFNKCSKITSLTLSNTIKSIGDEAFSYCENLESLTISKSVEAIGIDLFLNSSQLKELIVSEENEFYQAQGGILYSKDGKELISCINGVDNVSILESVENIYESAFEKCIRLTSIKIPNSVKKLNRYTFSYCVSLQKVELPESLKKISDSEFNNCISLKEIILPDSLEEIGYSAFNKCQSLISITIPSSTKSIGMEAFKNCSSLKKVEFLGCPDLSATSIFSSCDNLEEIICRSTTPPNCNTYIFENYSIPLYVPKGSLELYKEATGWKNFTSILPLEDVTKDNLYENNIKFHIYTTAQMLHITTSQNTTLEIYRANGTRVDSVTIPAGETKIKLDSGLYIIKIDNQTQKVLLL